MFDIRTCAPFMCVFIKLLNFFAIIKVENHFFFASFHVFLNKTLSSRFNKLFDGFKLWVFCFRLLKMGDKVDGMRNGGIYPFTFAFIINVYIQCH